MKRPFSPCVRPRLLRVLSIAAVLLFSGAAASGQSLNSPIGVATEASGMLVATDTNGPSIVRIDPAGGCTVVSSGAVGTGPALSMPHGIAVEAGGTLVVADLSGVLLRVDPASGDRTIVSGAGTGAGPALVGPWNLAIEATGDILALLPSGSVLRVDPVTGDRTIVSNVATGTGPAFVECYGITVEPGGDILVVDYVLDAVLRVDPVTGNRSIVSSGAVGSGPTFNSGVGMIVEPGGTLVLVDNTINAVFRVDLITGDRSLVSGSGAGSGPAFQNPLLVTMLPGGSLYVSDDLGGAVLEVDPVSGLRTPTSCYLPGQEIDLSITTAFIQRWNDSGSGANVDGSFWDPDILGTPNVYSFGSAARPNYAPPSQVGVGRSLTGIGVPGGAFAHPVGFTQIWNDAGSGANLDGSFWSPIPPPGYVSLGSVAQFGYAMPPVTSFVCVRSDLVVQGVVGNQIYNDSGSGANADFSAWDIVAPPGAIDVGTFIGVGNYAQPSNSAVWCLRADAVTTSTPTAAQLETLIATFGPIFRLHPSELYLPDDPTGVLDDPGTNLVWALVQNPSSFSSFNQTILGGSPTSSTTILDDVQAALSLPQATQPEFTYYLHFDVGLNGSGVPTLPLSLGNLDRAKAYVRVRPIDGVVTELQFWLWYPWNGPGKAQAECGSLPSVTFNPTGDAGTHYADWENVRIRLTNKTLSNPGAYTLLNAQLSRHSFDVEVPAANLLYDGTNPVVYVAKDSHAHYPGPGAFDYDRVSSTNVGLCTASVDTFDQTANGGPELDASTRYQLVSSEWPSIPTNAPDWFFFGGQWGGFDPNQFCVSAFGVNLYCFEEIGNGKPGLQARDGFDAGVPLDARLGSLRFSTESRGDGCSNADALISHVSPLQDTITLVGGPTSIQDVRVTVDLAHSSIGDLEITVTSPSGTSVVLHDNQSGTADSLFVHYTTSGNANAAPYHVGASMVAAEVLGTSRWIGEDASGTWTIDVVDTASGHDGVLNRWCVSTTDLSSVFDPQVTNYTLDLPAGTSSTFLTPQAMNHEAEVSVFFNGVTYPIETDANPIAGQGSLLGLSSPSLPLDPGVNSGTITVSFPGGPSRDYALTINVAVPPALVFRRGDVSDNGGVALNDVIVILGYLFSGGATPNCLDAADINDNGGVALDDVILLLGFLFQGGAPPAAPGPFDCGPDVNADSQAPCVSTSCP